MGTVALRFVEPTSAPETLFQTAVASYHKIREDKAVSILPCPIYISYIYHIHIYIIYIIYIYRSGRTKP